MFNRQVKHLAIYQQVNKQINRSINKKQDKVIKLICLDFENVYSMTSNIIFLVIFCLFRMTLEGTKM